MNIQAMKWNFDKKRVRNSFIVMPRILHKLYESLKIIQNTYKVLIIWIAINLIIMRNFPGTQSTHRQLKNRIYLKGKNFIPHKFLSLTTHNLNLYTGIMEGHDAQL